MKGLSNSDLKFLKSSPYVLKITESQIIFSEQFKNLMLESSIEGMTRQEAFNRTLGVNCFDKKFVDTCLNRWRRKLRADGDLAPGKKGRKKDLDNMTVEEMRAEIAYQKEVIAHLKKLRGLADDEL
jgi:transposase-like protein